MRLADLLECSPRRENQTAPPATVATLATLRPETPQLSQLSQLSQAAAFENAATDHAELRASLLAICRSHALPERLVANLPDAELEGCELLSAEGLVRWVQVLAENERMRQGIAPDGWTQASYCHHCSPVRLWADAPLHVIGCPWCHVRRAGGQVPRPAVTCANCAHQKRRSDTGDAGMQSCMAGHSTHMAYAEHACDDWRPDSSTEEKT